MTTKTLSLSEARRNFYGLVREVVDDAVPVVIRNRGRRNAVLISEDEYNSIMETQYLLSGRNGERLRQAEKHEREGKTHPITIEEMQRMLAQ